jgi:putative aldouronate transport system permease protein
MATATAERTEALRAETPPETRRPGLGATAAKSFRKHWQLYLLTIPPILYFIVFKYVPMVNAVIAFKDYNVVKGIWGSPWVGTKYFDEFFQNPAFGTLLRNTLVLSLYSLAISYPIPILLALLLNEVGSAFFKRAVQLVTYAPYFISVVVLVAILNLVLAPRVGIANQILGLANVSSFDFLGNADIFPSIYVWSGVWQGAGYAAVIYLAALASVDPTLYEAAKVDGASRLQKIIHIDLPSLMPTAIVILILSVGSLMAVGFEKVFLLQNPLNLSTSEVIQTYVYKVGLLNANFSFATAVGLFNSVANLILLLVVNTVARRTANTSLF